MSKDKENNGRKEEENEAREQAKTSNQPESCALMRQTISPPADILIYPTKIFNTST